MREYKIIYGMNEIISTSRDAKKHAENLGMDVRVFTKSGKLVSAAGLDENGKPFSKCIAIY